MPRVLIVCDGDGEPKLCVSSSHTNSPAFHEAYDLLKRGVEGHFQVLQMPQSQIDRFDLPGEES